LLSYFWPVGAVYKKHDFKGLGNFTTLDGFTGKKKLSEESHETVHVMKQVHLELATSGAAHCCYA
jgi:hypothetical protein